MEAIQNWETHTCVKFIEVDASYEDSHLIFTDSNECSSSIGRNPNSGQIVNLTKGCVEGVSHCKNGIRR